MVRRRSARQMAADAAIHLRRADAWHGLRAGDPVKVAGTGHRGVTWEFRAHVTNERNGTESIEVVGGRGGDRTVRSFDPERIFAVTGRPVRGSGRRSAPWPQPSLAEAPRLPLG